MNSLREQVTDPTRPEQRAEADQALSQAEDRSRKAREALARTPEATSGGASPTRRPGRLRAQTT